MIASFKEGRTEKQILAEAASEECNNTRELINKIVREKDQDANKFDADKVQLELIPPEALYEIGKVLTFGAKKYDAHNWRQGMKWTRLIGACLRHIFSWLSPLESDTDPESGLNHLAHAGCCIVMLLSYQQGGESEDDRYK